MKIIKGMGFPFRINEATGGVVMSKIDINDSTRYVEAVQQVLGTKLVNERVMEIIGSDLDTHIFDPMDSSTKTLIKYECAEAIEKFVPSVTVTKDDIDLNVHTDSDGNDIGLYALVKFTVKETGESSESEVYIGGVDNG